MLVNGLDLAGVEEEGLLRLTSEDHHLVVIHHDAAGGLRAHEDRVNDFKKDPLLARDPRSIRATVLVARVLLLSTSVERRDSQVVS